VDGVADVFSRGKRSAVMAAIRAKNTRPELVVRRLLHLMGYRFRLHVPTLPGKPDIVIPRAGTIIQVKGCFWHGHHCLKGRIPSGNRPYWASKIAGNKLRDRRNERRLRALGWRVRTIWECDIRRSSAAELHQRLRAVLPRRRRAGKTVVVASRLAPIEDALLAIKQRRKAL
jgi:DNA mismatch endonuclease (patch repair protein)